MNNGGYMKKNKHRFFVISALAIIILALHPLVGLAFEETSATQPVSYSLISIDIPNSSGELGFTSWLTLTTTVKSQEDSQTAVASAFYSGKRSDQQIFSAPGA